MTYDQFFEKVDSVLFGYQLVNDEQRREISHEIAQKGLTYEHALHQCASVDPAAYTRVLEEVSGCVAVDPSQIAIDPEFIAVIVDVLPLDVIAAFKVFPVSLHGNELVLALPNPTDLDLIYDLQATTCLRIQPVVTTFRSIQPSIDRTFLLHLSVPLQLLRHRSP